jgi:phosphohistidine swiveling domain-containing protein
MGDIDRFLNQDRSSPTPIELNAFDQWISKNEMWFGEAPLMLYTVQICTEQLAGSKPWFGTDVTFAAFVLEKDYGYQVLSIKESNDICESQLQAIHHHPDRLAHYFDEWNARVAKLETVVSRLEFVSMERLSQDQLWKEFQTLNNAMADFWNVTLVIEGNGPYLDHAYLPRFEKIVGDSKKAKEAFSVLTTPMELSFVGESRKELLEMIIRHLHSPRERKELFEKETPEALAIIRATKPELYRALVEYQQKYYWLQNSYGEWTILTINDFFEFVRDALKNQSIKDLQTEYEKLENPEEIIARQNKWLNELRLPEKTVKEIEFIRKTTWLKDERKRHILKMLHPQYRFLHEFARRAGIEPKLMANALIQEIPYVVSKAFPVSKLEERRELSIYIAAPQNKSLLVSGNEAVLFKQKLFGSGKSKTDQAIYGVVASQGTQPVVTGKVKVILNPKDQTISEDEILVTSMTRPDFMPLMKSAKGFITNEGGITCHAAIVSREMNKPCIIGTKYATQVLQSGDEVEMRMNHGIITIKRRAVGVRG